MIVENWASVKINGIWTPVKGSRKEDRFYFIYNGKQYDENVAYIIITRRSTRQKKVCEHECIYLNKKDLKSKKISRK